MPCIPKAALLAAALIAAAPAAADERPAVVAREAFACTSWAGWHEYGLASLRPRGAWPSKHCPIRIRVRSKVTIVEEDAGEGSTVIRYRGKLWYVDNQRLR